MNDDVREILSASASGNQSILVQYLGVLGTLNCIDEEGSTPLMFAAANGQEKVVRFLLEHGRVEVDQQNLYGWTALLQASCYGHHEVVFTLLNHNADINLCNSWGASTLVAAAQGGFMTVVQILLEKGAGINVMDEVLSITPLMAAAQCGSEPIVSTLIAAGSNVNARLQITGWTALMLAALNNHLVVVETLLKHGAVREMRDVNNKRAIDLARSLEHNEIVNLLSEEALATSLTDIDIFEAVKQGNVTMLKEALKKHKASASVTDKDGATPLMYAARKGNLEICKLLLEYGPDVDAQDHIHGWTAFIHSAHHKHYDVAQLLTQHGANVTLRAKNGASAFDIANLIGDARVIQLIAQVTIQRLSEKNKEGKSMLITVDEEEEVHNTSTGSERSAASDKSPSKSLSPPGDDLPDSGSTAAILRRLSNAYHASETKPVIDEGRLSPRIVTPFRRTPSPEILEPCVLPSITKPQHLKPIDLNPQSGWSKPPSLKETKEVKFASNPTTIPTTPTATPSLGSQGSSNIKKFSHSTSRGNSTPSNGNRPRQMPGFLKSSPRSTSNLPTKAESKPRPYKSPTGAVKPLGLNNLKGSGQPHPPYKGQPKSKTFEKLKLKPINTKGPDLQSALNSASLGHYYVVFEREEMDITSFLTLTEQDLIDIGIDNTHDRGLVLSLITHLRENPPRSPVSPSPISRSAGFQYALQK